MIGFPTNVSKSDAGQLSVCGGGEAVVALLL